MDKDRIIEEFVLRKKKSVCSSGFTPSVMGMVAAVASGRIVRTDFRFGRNYMLALAACVVLGVILGILLGENLPVPGSPAEAVFCYENMQIENYFFNG